MTSIVVQFSDIEHAIHKALEAFMGECDSKQWPLAGVELGRVMELANRLAATAALAKDALWDESAKGG